MNYKSKSTPSHRTQEPKVDPTINGDEKSRLGDTWEKDGKVIPLPLVHRANGITLNQVKRNRHVAMYKAEIGNNYEVFEIRIRKGESKFGKYYPARERYPGNEDFGTWAYSLTGRERAEEVFEVITERQRKKSDV